MYATVDVQGQLEERLPPPAQPLAAPLGVAVRGLATDVAERALADPRVQNLVTTAVTRAHGQFVALIDNESAYVSKTGGEVVLEYGDVVADLAVRLGLDPNTIADIRSIVQSVSQELRTNLTDVQARIQTVRTGLADAQGSAPSPELVQALTEFQVKATALQKTIADVGEKIKGVEDKVPSALQDRLTDLRDRLASLGARISELRQLNGAVIKNPTRENIAALDARLAPADELITAVLERPAVQTPGELVVMDSDQLDAVQSIVSALRNLGFVLPLLVLLLYVAAIFLAKGWRSPGARGDRRRNPDRDAPYPDGTSACGTPGRVHAVQDRHGRACGPGSLGHDLRRASRARAVHPRRRARVHRRGASRGAGPPRHYGAAVARAPSARAPGRGLCRCGGPLPAWLAFIPGINNFGQVLTIVLLAVLAFVGVDALRRQTAREFPERLNVP